MIDILIDSTQKRLVELYGPEHYYTTGYRQHERDYWGAIPDWIRQDVELQQHNNTGMVSILDIGPGWGTLSCVLSRMYADSGKVLAIDRHQLMSEDVIREYNLGYQTRDIERQSCPRAPFGWDIVIMTEVLEHFNFHPVRTLQHIKDQLSERGRIYLSTPNQLDCWGKVRRYPTLAEIPPFDPGLHTYNDPVWFDGHVWQYTHQEVLETVESAGLKAIRWGRCRSAGGGHLIYTLTV